MYRVKRPVKIFGVEYAPMDYISMPVLGKIVKTQTGRDLISYWVQKDWIVEDDSASGEMPEIKEEDLI